MGVNQQAGVGSGPAAVSACGAREQRLLPDRPASIQSRKRPRLPAASCDAGHRAASSSHQRAEARLVERGRGRTCTDARTEGAGRPPRPCRGRGLPAFSARPDCRRVCSDLQTRLQQHVAFS